MGISFSIISSNSALESFPPESEIEQKLLLFSFVFVKQTSLNAKKKPRKEQVLPGLNVLWGYPRAVHFSVEPFMLKL